MIHTHSIIFSCILGATLSLGVEAATPGQALIYFDSFETADDFAWTMFEELVNDCANAGVGKVEFSSDMNLGSGIGGTLAVRSNDALQAGTNHVLAQRKLADVGLQGQFSYQVSFYVDLNVLPLTQTGPELSLQNTAPTDMDPSTQQPIYRTMTGGIQYVGNKWISNKWKIWSTVASDQASNSDTAAWVDLVDPQLPRLEQEGWWTLKMFLDYDTAKYTELHLTAPDDTVTQISLTSYDIAREDKFHEGAFWATLEAQNLYDCNGVHTFDAYYDNVEIMQSGAVVPEAPTVEDVSSNVHAGESAVQSFPGMLLSVLHEPQIGSVEVVDDTLVYTATSPGGDGIKFKVCDPSSFLCGESWWTISSPNRPPNGVNAYTQTAACGETILLDSPFSDPDNNLDLSTAALSDPNPPVGNPAVVVTEDDILQFSFEVPSSGSGEFGFHAKVCDDQPWGWCTGAWLVVAWSC